MRVESKTSAEPAAARGLRDVVTMTVGRLATQAVLVVAAVVVPRVLGPEAYGQFAAAMALLAIFQSVSAFGLPMVEMRQLAPLWRLGEASRAVVLGSTIWTTRLALSLASGASVAVCLALSPDLGLGLVLCGVVGLLALLRYAHETTKNLLLPLGRVRALTLFDLARAGLTLGVAVTAFPAFGLPGLFAGLALLQALLLVAAWRVLRGIAPIGPVRARWSALRPHLPFTVATFAGALAGMLQAQFSVYAVANWVARQEAAYLGIAVQIYTLLQILFISARRALTPVLAELEVRGQSGRLRTWGGVMLRYGAAAATVGVVAWALLGASIVSALLTDRFAPVHGCAAAILVAVLFFYCGASCNGLLYIRGHAITGAANTMLFALATIAGTGLALRGDGEGAALQIARVYAGSAALFFATAYLSLGWRGGLWLPLRRTLLLILPAALAGPAIAWGAGLPERVVALAFFLVAYGIGAARLGLLPVDELREIRMTLRSARAAGRG